MGKLRLHSYLWYTCALCGHSMRCEKFTAVNKVTKASRTDDTTTITNRQKCFGSQKVTTATRMFQQSLKKLQETTRKSL